MFFMRNWCLTFLRVNPWGGSWIISKPYASQQQTWLAVGVSVQLWHFSQQLITFSIVFYLFFLNFKKIYFWLLVLIFQAFYNTTRSAISSLIALRVTSRMSDRFELCWCQLHFLIWPSAPLLLLLLLYFWPTSWVGEQWTPGLMFF